MIGDTHFSSTDLVQLNLTKTVDPADYILLGEQLKVVDEHFGKDSTQHEARRWEYAMALRALREWSHSQRSHGAKVVAADIGGAGSPLWRMLADRGVKVKIIDPKLKREKREEPSTVEAYGLLGVTHDVVVCISVVEHVKDEHLVNFLDALAKITAPGGLLFMTMDCWGRDADERDIAMFHWMRERIYTEKSWQGLAKEMVKRGFKLFGMPDWSYHGDQVDSAYSFCSLSMQKVEETIS